MEASCKALLKIFSSVVNQKWPHSTLIPFPDRPQAVQCLETFLTTRIGRQPPTLGFHLPEKVTPANEFFTTASFWGTSTIMRIITVEQVCEEHSNARYSHWLKFHESEFTKVSHRCTANGATALPWLGLTNPSVAHQRYTGHGHNTRLTYAPALYVYPNQWELSLQAALVYQTSTSVTGAQTICTTNLPIPAFLHTLVPPFL